MGKVAQVARVNNSSRVTARPWALLAASVTALLTASVTAWTSTTALASPAGFGNPHATATSSAKARFGVDGEFYLFPVPAPLVVARASWFPVPAFSLTVRSGLGLGMSWQDKGPAGRLVPIVGSLRLHYKKGFFGVEYGRLLVYSPEWFDMFSQETVAATTEWAKPVALTTGFSTASMEVRVGVGSIESAADTQLFVSASAGWTFARL